MGSSFIVISYLKGQDLIHCIKPEPSVKVSVLQKHITRFTLEFSAL